MGVNVEKRLEVSERLETLKELVNSGEQLSNDDSEVEEYALKYVKWRDHCEIILENSIGMQSFTNKFKEAKNHAQTSLDKIELAKLLSININCLKSFCKSIEHKEVGKWRAKYRDTMFLLKNFFYGIYEDIRMAIGVLVFSVVIIFGFYFLDYISKPHPQINKMTHDVQCNQYGICDK